MHGQQNIKKKIVRNGSLDMWIIDLSQHTYHVP